MLAGEVWHESVAIATQSRTRGRQVATNSRNVGDRRRTLVAFCAVSANWLLQRYW